MKKRSFILMVCGLALMLFMYNCKKDDKDPTDPDPALIEELEKIKMEEVTLDAPAAVQTTASSLTVSTEAAAVATGLSGIAASGQVPASITTAATEVSASLSASEVATLNSLTPAAISAIEAGGALSPQLKAVMDKVAADPVLKKYLPVITLPTVAGVAVTARIGTIEEVEQIEDILVDDACVAKGQAAFDTKKAELDAAKITEDGKVTAAYDAAIAPLNAAENACKSSAGTKFTTIKDAVKAQITTAKADLEAAKTVLGEATYGILLALINAAEVGAFSSIATLTTADANACTKLKEASTAAAQVARDANLAKVKAVYDKAIAEANTARATAIQSCHNQGGGN